MMDLRTVLTIFTLLIMTAESVPTTRKPTSRETPITAQINNTSRTCSCPSPVTAATADPTSIPSTSTLALGLLAISWKNNCKGDVTLTLHQPSNSPAHPHDPLIVCSDSEIKLQSLFENVCQKKIGCQGKPHWFERKVGNGYSIKGSGAEMRESCNKLMVECTVEVLPDVQGQLKAYKVVTALLCCVLLLLLLIRFTRPTVKALQKRLSNKRQNRWVGPTQSHSVSYHRGKTAVKNNDGEKRLSYPALERLAVSDSREPSSNRSSYNF